MPQSLAANQIPATILPGMGTALAIMGGSAVVGGIGGAAAIFSLAGRGMIPVRRGWIYGGIGAGVALGGAIGYFGGRFIIARTLAKLEEAESAAASKEQQA